MARENDYVASGLAAWRLDGLKKKKRSVAQWNTCPKMNLPKNIEVTALSGAFILGQVRWDVRMNRYVLRINIFGEKE